jgi:hypothetical protein
MKEFRFILASLALLSLGMASCVSGPDRLSQLDLSAVDPAQPIPVIGILLQVTYAGPGSNDSFLQKYGDGDWNEDQKKITQLLDILCGTASRNWTSIAAKVKDKTGLTLNGEEFLNDFTDGATDRVKMTPGERKGIGTSKYYFFQWTAIEDVEYGAVINLSCRFSTGAIEPFSVELQQLDEMGGAVSKITLTNF